MYHEVIEAMYKLKIIIVIFLYSFVNFTNKFKLKSDTGINVWSNDISKHSFPVSFIIILGSRWCLNLFYTTIICSQTTSVILLIRQEVNKTLCPYRH